MNRILNFGEPFLSAVYLEAEGSYDVATSAILINLDKEKDVLINGEFSLPALTAMTVQDVNIAVQGKALLITGYDKLELTDEVIASLCDAWTTGNNVYYKSPKAELGNVSVNFCLVSKPVSPSGIHRDHPDLMVQELHVQIIGCGFVDLLKAQDPDTVYASMPLAPGSTHMHTWNADNAYTWHRYRNITPCMFLGVEVH